MSEYHNLLLQTFLEESVGLLDSFESGLIEFEENIGNPSIDIHNEIFRAIHSLKGSSQRVGMKEISSFTHTIENLI